MKLILPFDIADKLTLAEIDELLLVNEFNETDLCHTFYDKENKQRIYTQNEVTK